MKEINGIAEDTANTLDMELGAKTGGLKLLNATPHGWHFRVPRKVLSMIVIISTLTLTSN
jgi:hypothetical protein